MFAYLPVALRASRRFQAPLPPGKVGSVREDASRRTPSAAARGG